jgi:ribonuclease-3
VVNARVLAHVAGRLQVGEVLLLGKGEEGSGGRTKASILADAFEAILGAVYLDAGWEAARALVLRELGVAIERAGEEPDDFDHKSRLQEKAVRDGEGTPRYVVVGSGPDHDRAYVAEVYLGATCWGTGEGRSKKDAEQAAARAAWEELTDA